MTTKALTTRPDQILTTTDPPQLWDEAVSRYLEIRKSGPSGGPKARLPCGQGG
jgi:hypothetical protein